MSMLSQASCDKSSTFSQKILSFAGLISNSSLSLPFPCLLQSLQPSHLQSAFYSVFCQSFQLVVHSTFLCFPSAEISPTLKLASLPLQSLSHLSFPIPWLSPFLWPFCFPTCFSSSPILHAMHIYFLIPFH